MLASSGTGCLPIILERGGERFRLSRDEDIAYEPDPEGVRDVGGDGRQLG